MSSGRGEGEDAPIATIDLTGPHVLVLEGRKTGPAQQVRRPIWVLNIGMLTHVGTLHVFLNSAVNICICYAHSGSH